MLRISPAFPLRTLLLLGSVVAAGSFLFSIGQRTIQIYQLQQEEVVLRREVAGLEVRNKQLLEQREGLNNDADIERIAREELNLIKPGETAVVVLPSPEVIARMEQQTAAPQEITGSSSKSWWERLFHR